MVEGNSERFDSVDGDLLATLCDDGPDYGPVIAFEADATTDGAEDRFRELCDRGFAERVSEEPLYRATDRGERFAGAQAGADSPLVLSD